MALEQIQGHEPVGIVKLAPPFWGKPRIASWLVALLAEIQVLEDAIWSYLDGLDVDTCDRWVLEGLAKQRGREFDAITVYVDYQTQLPLYVMTKRRDGRLVEIGIPVHRFSGDVFDYPQWPGGERAFVFDPVAAVYSTPPPAGRGGGANRTRCGRSP